MDPSAEQSAANARELAAESASTAPGAPAVDDKTVRWPDRPLPVFVAAIVAVAVIAPCVWWLARAGVPTINDLGQLLRTTREIERVRLDTAMFQTPVRSFTSPPGWPLLIVAVAKASGATIEQANVWLAWASWFAVVFATAVVIRAAGISLRTPRALATVAVAAANVGAAASLYEFFHPQDLGALAFILFAFAAVFRRRWGWAGVLLGVALSMRHLMVLPALVILMLAPRWRDRASLAAGMVMVPMVVSWPFLVANPQGFFDALKAQIIVSLPVTPSGRILVAADSEALTWFVARVAPLVIAALVCGFVSRRRLACSPTVVLGAAGTVLVSRLVFEPAPFIYYCAPAVAVAAAAAVVRRQWPWLALVASVCFFGVGDVTVRQLARQDAYAPRVLLATACWTVGMIACQAALGKWWTGLEKRRAEGEPVPASPQSHTHVVPVTVTQETRTATFDG